MKSDVTRLLVSCSDRHGIIAALSSAVAESGANIVSSDQYSTDPEGGAFFLRMEVHLEGLAERRHELEERLGVVGQEFAMRWRLTPADERKRVALLTNPKSSQRSGSPSARDPAAVHCVGRAGHHPGGR